MKYCVDIVLCIDSTGSMGPVIDRAKAGALRFQDDLMASMLEKDKKIDVMRVKVISFRDYYYDGDMSMVVSPFFKLPDERDKYETFVRSIQATGGEDDPETGMEALALAIKSDWTKEGDKQRHVICFWTDTSAHPLEGHEKGMPRPSNYPNGMPASFDELQNWWGTKMDKNFKRLLLYAPDAYPWTDISNYWDNVLHYPSQAGEGLEEMDYKTIIKAIAESIKLQ